MVITLDEGSSVVIMGTGAGDLDGSLAGRSVLGSTPAKGEVDYVRMATQTQSTPNLRELSYLLEASRCRYPSFISAAARSLPITNTYNSRRAQLNRIYHLFTSRYHRTGQDPRARRNKGYTPRQSITKTPPSISHHGGQSKVGRRSHTVERPVLERAERGQEQPDRECRQEVGSSTGRRDGRLVSRVESSCDQEEAKLYLITCAWGFDPSHQTFQYGGADTGNGGRSTRVKYGHADVAGQGDDGKARNPQRARRHPRCCGQRQVERTSLVSVATK